MKEERQAREIGKTYPIEMKSGKTYPIEMKSGKTYPVEMKSGFYISCKKGREDKAFKEVSSVLSNLLNSSKKYSIYEQINIEEELKIEVKSLLVSPFRVYFKYSSMLFVSNNSCLSSTQLYALLRKEDVSFVLVHRVVPIDYFFKFDEARLCELISGLDPEKSYKIIYEERFVPKCTRERVFGCITSFLTLKVDLTNPYYLIVVQALKNNVGISVVRGERSNFNLSKDEKRG